jgi:hypothetical protein
MRFVMQRTVPQSELLPRFLPSLGAIPINYSCDDDGFREKLNPSYELRADHPPPRTRLAMKSKLSPNEAPPAGQMKKQLGCSSPVHIQLLIVCGILECHRKKPMKLKFALVGLAALASLAAGGTASAMPAATPGGLGSSDGAVIQVRGGHGHGHGHMGHAGRGHHYGWGRGRGHHYGWRHHRH